MLEAAFCELRLGRGLEASAFRKVKRGAKVLIADCSCNRCIIA